MKYYALVKMKEGDLQTISLKDKTISWINENVLEVLSYYWY